MAPAIAMLAWGGNHFSPLLLLYRQDEHYSQVVVDLLFAVYIVGIIPGFLIAGPVSDRLGRRRTLLGGVALGTVASAVLAVGPASIPLLSVGRFVSGLSVAAAMVVGSTWIKELSVPPYDAVSAPAAARRASLTLTAGFGIGPAVSGVLAQWGPAPTVLPYLVQIGLLLASVPLLLGAVETRTERARVPLRSCLGVPRAARARFAAVIVPAGPWVFGSAGVAFAVTPALVRAQTGSLGIAYATLLAVVTLVFGAGIQPFAPAIGRRTGGRQLLVGLALTTGGLLAVAVVAGLRNAWVGLAAAALLGASYGVILVSGLTEVQRTTPPERLAGATAVYYSVTYVGFTFPVVLAGLESVAPAALLLVALAAVALACLARVSVALRTA